MRFETWKITVSFRAGEFCHSIHIALRGNLIHANLDSVQASFDETTNLPVTAESGDEFDPGEGYTKDWIEYARQKLPRMFFIHGY